jgi:colanic acid biosynthesis glycosyl transferase WcaI
MRLAVYSHNYWPEPTGIPYYNTGMCRWLARRQGWQVTVRTGLPHYPWWHVPEAYAARDYDHGRGDEIVDGVAVERVRHFVPSPPPSCLARMRLDLSWLTAVAWRSLGTRQRPDAIILIAPPFLIGLLGLWLRLRWRVPVVYHVQDLQVDAAIELGMMPRVLTAILLGCERVILGNIDLVTTISAAMRRQVSAKTGGRKAVGSFPNWVDDRGMRPWSGPNRFRLAWGASGETTVAMYAGNLGRKQGLEVLVAAAALLPPHILVVIAGAGGERAALERIAATSAPGRIRFCDLVDAADLPEFLSAGDIHCVVQRAAVAEAVMPSKLLNIMAVERPVVVTAGPGTDLAQAVLAASAGIVVPTDDPDALATAIISLAGDPECRTRSGVAARLWVVATYGIDRVLARFAGRLRLLAAAGTQRRGENRTRWVQVSPSRSIGMRKQRTGGEITEAIPVAKGSVIVPAAPPLQLIPTVPVPALNTTAAGPSSTTSAPGTAISNGRLRNGASRPAKSTPAVISSPPSTKP